MTTTFYTDIDGRHVSEQKYFSLPDIARGIAYCICQECGCQHEVHEVCCCELEIEEYEDDEKETTVMTVVKQIEAIEYALEAANEGWDERVSTADYEIKIVIQGKEYPLFINAVEINNQLQYALDNMKKIATEEGW